MLILSRRLGEVINIGDDIAVRVVRISGNRARLAVEAPKHLIIERQEDRRSNTSEKTES